jgi:hypothetical protein
MVLGNGSLLLSRRERLTHPVASGCLYLARGPSDVSFKLTNLVVPID